MDGDLVLYCLCIPVLSIPLVLLAIFGMKAAIEDLQDAIRKES